MPRHPQHEGFQNGPELNPRLDVRWRPQHFERALQPPELRLRVDGRELRKPAQGQPDVTGAERVAERQQRNWKDR